MFAKLKHVGVIGAAIAGVGWMTTVSPVVAYAQPPRIPPGTDITCPNGGPDDVQYLPDPDDPNAYYVCAGGVEQQHRSCPTEVIMTTPPRCRPSSNHHSMP
ncbi:hypothetical protein [Mycobacterium xenopi]|uniref:hypothetical protein n=1 Tax=Mycobacterium xenopi TaxID=1789 RepID=UPI0022EAC22B|nr:hypothetical protein [Mycobacterium xenopi]MDA3659027.1 hypothetical protein [Mycobacterium xenopi]